jgi:hypothetical protein
MASRPCTAICAGGSPCEAWAVRGSDPALCVAHGGGRWPVGAPAGNTNALRHGYYTGPELPEDCTIDAIIDMLYHKQIALDDFIDQILSIGQPAVEELAHLLKIHGQNASRLGRLLRDRRALSGDAAHEDGYCTTDSLRLRRDGLNAAPLAANGVPSGEEASSQVKAICEATDQNRQEPHPLTLQNAPRNTSGDALAFLLDLKHHTCRALACWKPVPAAACNDAAPPSWGLPSKPSVASV